ncbi:hypothetical protein CHUAL_004845 [Chamberlinius hualienensis]
MLKRDLVQRSCRLNKVAETPQTKGAHIRKNKTPLKRQKIVQNTPKTSQDDVGMVSCRKCRHEFDKRSQFDEHNCCEESELYQCHTCKLLFNHRKRFQEHMKQHRQNECKMCGQQFLRRKALLIHSKFMHGITELEKNYSCSHCDRKFIKKPSLISHLKTHADQNKIVCVKCGVISDNEEEHKKHCEIHSTEPTFSCGRCDATFRRRQQLIQHMAGHDKHNCHLCQINFSTKKQLEQHKKKVHDIAVTAVKKHQCNLCSKNFYRPATLKKHIEVHHSDPKSPPKQIKSTTTDEKKFLCAVCGKQFTKSQALNRHKLLIHSDPTTLQCEICGYKTASKCNMKRHRETHQEKRYICEICGAAFHAHATLQQHHVYVHSDKREFTCKICSKDFKTLSALQRHERIHNDARPFECHCGQKYKRKSHLKRHISTMHDNKRQQLNTVEFTSTFSTETSQNSISSDEADLLLLSECQQTVSNFLNAECQQQNVQNVDEMAYLSSEMMTQIADDVIMPALEQSIMSLNQNVTQTSDTNSLICPMSVLDDMELHPNNYNLQNDSLEFSEIMLKHAAASFRNDMQLNMSIDLTDCNINSNNCNFDSYLYSSAFRDQNQYDPSNYQQFQF